MFLESIVGKNGKDTVRHRCFSISHGSLSTLLQHTTYFTVLTFVYNKVSHSNFLPTSHVSRPVMSAFKDLPVLPRKKKIPNASKNDMFTTTGNDVLLNNHSAHCNQSTVKHMPLVWRCHGLPSHKVPANNFFWKNSPHSKNQGEAERKCTQRYYKKMNHICL